MNNALFFSQKIADKNSEIMNMYFQLNRILDNFVNWIEVNLCMNNLSKAIHINYAHKAPLDADRFSEYNAIFGYRAKYGVVKPEIDDYENILEGLDYILGYLADMDNIFSDAKKLGKAEENDDYIKFISEEVKNLRQYKNQFIFLYDKISKALEGGNTLQDIDFHCQDFLVGN